MVKRTIAVLLLLCGFAAAQQPATKPTPTAGAVTAGVYRNNYFGFEYQLPAGFIERTAAMPQSGGGITFALLYASEPKQPTRVASSVTLFADDANHWQAKNGAEYLDKVGAQMSKQADLVGKLTALDIGGHQFFRQDFQPHARFPVRQTIVATVLKGYVLSAVLTAGDAAGIETLLAGWRAAKFWPKPKLR